MCKRVKFEKTTNWYLHKPGSENEMHKIHLDSEIKIVLIIPAVLNSKKWKNYKNRSTSNEYQSSIRNFVREYVRQILR